MKKKILLITMAFLSMFLITGCNKEETQLEDGKLIKNVDYFVRGEFTGQYLDLTKRGYYIDTQNRPDAPYFYIICMGQKSTGGYSLEVKEVNRVNGRTEIIVEEIVPGPEEMVTMAFTSPTIYIEFPKYQENIVIKNTNGEEFVKLED